MAYNTSQYVPRPLAAPCLGTSEYGVLGATREMEYKIGLALIVDARIQEYQARQMMQQNRNDLRR